jgi:hypothetical protein
MTDKITFFDRRGRRSTSPDALWLERERQEADEAWLRRQIEELGEKRVMATPRKKMSPVAINGDRLDEARQQTLLLKMALYGAIAIQKDGGAFEKTHEALFMLVSDLQDNLHLIVREEGA